MASLKYFLLSLFVFLCLSCSSANRVLLDSHVEDQDLPLNKPVDGNHAPIIETGFGFGHGAGGSSIGRGIGSGIGAGWGTGGSGYGIGSGSGYGPGFGGWTGPGFGGGSGNGCILGYVCPSMGRGGCNNFPYGGCQSYNFFPLSPNPMDLHEVEIKWAENKPVEMEAQHDDYGAAMEPRSPPFSESHQPTGAQNGV